MIIVQKMRNFIGCGRQIVLRQFPNQSRRITTGQKVGEVGSVTMEAEAQQVKPKKKIRNWQSLGFDFVDQRRDYFFMHCITFGSVFVVLWGSWFLFAYYPDLGELAWAGREARIQIRRREILGLPMVDPNYADPAAINLPPDEELEQEDIII